MSPQFISKLKCVQFSPLFYFLNVIKFIQFQPPVKNNKYYIFLLNNKYFYFSWLNKKALRIWKGIKNHCWLYIKKAFFSFSITLSPTVISPFFTHTIKVKHTNNSYLFYYYNMHIEKGTQCPPLYLYLDRTSCVWWIAKIIQN